ncbi:MAG: hypothetical protein AAF545_14920 [Pseudomonadota bacterium]
MRNETIFLKGLVFLALTVSLSACWPVPVTDYQDRETNDLRDSLRQGQADDTIRLLDTDYRIVPDFHRFADAEDVKKRHGLIRVVSKRPIKIQFDAIVLTDLDNGNTITGDASDTIETRVPWAYRGWPYDAVDYVHYEDRVLVFRHTDPQLDGFGGPERVRLTVTYRIEGEEEPREEQFDLVRTRYVMWVTE